ncbi:hypothetical protein RISK_006554 [Rhodopirellula islandica]|uniref:Uncharacterized protein n=1 Tax=Rhodopirellula islandica TaxID=595434 RepID=A0A0J1B481_RHOIS|nr:hypothetical protein RISK_006554 [Rhodopirellula islandica]
MSLHFSSIFSIQFAAALGLSLAMKSKISDKSCFVVGEMNSFAI